VSASLCGVIPFPFQNFIFSVFRRATSLSSPGSIREPTGGTSMTRKRFVVITLGIVAFGFASVANAGTEIVRDYGGAEINNYAAPPPPPVYYAPPPTIGVVVYPAYAYYGPRFRVFGARRFYGRRFHSRFHHWD
jgi:hypothetical protein